MRKISLIICLCLIIMLCGCKPAQNATVTTDGAPVAGTEDQSPIQNDTQSDWELPIDVDDFLAEDTTDGETINQEQTTDPVTTSPSQGGEQTTENENPVVEQTTESSVEQVTEPAATEPQNQSTEPPATQPQQPTEPPVSTPVETVPVATNSSGAIELPMIPG